MMVDLRFQDRQDIPHLMEDRNLAMPGKRGYHFEITSLLRRCRGWLEQLNL